MKRMNVKTSVNGVVEKVLVIINPTDSRPVTCWAFDDFDETGEIHFSPGTAADLLLLKWWLDFMGDAAADEYFERRKQEDDRDEKLDGMTSVDTDDIPF